MQQINGPPSCKWFNMLAATACLQAQTGETVVLAVNEISSALRRQYGNDFVPESLSDLLT